jgi:hypothetical protein
MEEQHLEPLSYDEETTFDNCDSSDDDSSVEITSTIDESENELVRLSTYLQLESDDESDDQRNFEWPDPPSFLTCSSSSDVEEVNDTQQVMISTTPIMNTDDTQEKSMKRKRRQWTIKEKLRAVALFDKIQSKHETAKREGCTRSQLRNWIENKENLINVCKKKRGLSLFSFS